jgi:hypothetical protein
MVFLLNASPREITVDLKWRGRDLWNDETIADVATFAPWQGRVLAWN